MTPWYHKLSRQLLRISAIAASALSMGSALAGYQVGVGKADMTGVDLGNSGAAWAIAPPLKGLQSRLFARAFLVADDETRREFLFVVAEDGMPSVSVKNVLLQQLNAIDHLQGRFTNDNVALLATHTHGAPSAQQAKRPKLLKVQVDALVNAVTEAVRTQAPATIKYARQNVTSVDGRNRSLQAFELNKATDKQLFPLKKDTLMSQLVFERNGQAIGALSFYGLHPISMVDEGYFFVTSDNYGYAARKMEDNINSGRAAGAQPFVAAFAQTGAGDQTPNINFDRCDDSKWSLLNPSPLSRHDWGCKRGISELGPFESMRLSGEQLAAAALGLMPQATRIDVNTPKDQRLNYAFQAQQLAQQSVAPRYTGEAKPQTTCAPAWGASFMAGSTEDLASVLALEGVQPGFQLARVASWLANLPGGTQLLDLLGFSNVSFQPLTPEIRACHAPKDVIGAPNPTPTEVGVMRLGALTFAFAPFELTTMTQFRLRRDLANDMNITDNRDVLVVSYAVGSAPSLSAATGGGYIVTPEEYASQQYEGGYAVFGKWSQPALSQALGRVGKMLVDNNGPTSAPTHTALPQAPSAMLTAANKPLEQFDAPTGWDGGPWLSTPGKVLEQPRMVQRQDFNGKVVIGDKRRFIQTQFVSGHPMHRPQQTTAAMPENTFFFIKKLNANGRWETVDRDGRWRSTIEWNDVPLCINCRSATVMWQIPDDAEGTYQVVHQGWWKPFWFSNELQTFSQASESFRIAKN